MCAAHVMRHLRVPAWIALLYLIHLCALQVNPAKEKKLSNVRSKQADEKLTLHPARVVTLEDSIGYIQWDELIEITPDAVRLRKKVLNPADRKKFMRSNSELS